MRLLLVAMGVCLLALLSWFLLLGGDMEPQAPQFTLESQSAAVALEPGDLASAPTELAASASRQAAAAVEPKATRPAQPSPTELWGRVIDAQSKAPVANADIELLHCEADEFWNLDLQYGKRVTTLGRTQSDADGRFLFDVVRRAHPHRLRVQAAGYATVTVPDNMGGNDVTIELSSGASVTGIVKCDERLLADIDVRIVVKGSAIELAQTRTDADGVFRCQGLPPARAILQVSSPEFEEVWKQLDIEAGLVHQITIEMKAGKALRGRVVEATTGRPIAGAEVATSWTFKRAVSTDTMGRFLLKGLRDSDYLMCHVRAPGYASVRQSVSGKLDEECEIRLVQGGAVAGRVVDESGKPVPSAYVAVAADFAEQPGIQGCDWIPASMDNDGRFQVVSLLVDQHYWLLARAAGFGTRVYALPHIVGSGERLDLGDVVLRAAGGIEGRVVDENGTTIPRASVSLSGCNDDSKSWLASGEPTRVFQFEMRHSSTDALGVFRFAGLAAGQYSLRAEASWGSEVTQIVGVADGAQQEGILLTIPRGKAISGTVELPSGEPLGQLAAETWLQLIDDRGGYRTCQIAADGAFRVEGLSDQAYTLSMPHPPEGFQLVSMKEIMPGGPPLRLVLEHASFVAGRVIDQDGKPLRAQVYVYSLEIGGVPLDETDDQGQFRIEVPAAFRGTVVARAPDDASYKGQVTDVRAGQSDLVITLAKQ